MKTIGETNHQNQKLSEGYEMEPLARERVTQPLTSVFISLSEPAGSMCASACLPVNIQPPACSGGAPARDRGHWEAKVGGSDSRKRPVGMPRGCLSAKLDHRSLLEIRVSSSELS